MLHVAALTGGQTVPSARFRVRQYIAPLRAHEIELTEHPARLGAYPPARRWLRPAWAAVSLAQRLPALLHTHAADVTLLQRSLISTYVTLEGWSGRPRVLDVDDALWVHPRGHFAARLAALCDGVICGNDFLAAHFARWNAQVEIIPTGVDTERFCPASPLAHDDFVIGWSGSAGNLAQLEGLEPVLARVLAAVPHSRLLVTSNRAPRLAALSPARVAFVPWSEQNEVATIQRMDVGLMPLEDTEWNRGKCSYKMLLYMACAKPVVVSPVGMNRAVLAMGDLGLGAATLAEWEAALVALGRNPEAGTAMGAAGRAVVEAHFSRAVTAAALARHLLRYA